MFDLDSLTLQHHRLFVVLYPSAVKPEWRHSFHVSETTRSMSANVWCFPMVRKRREAKASSLTVCRYFESTILREIAHRQLESLADGSL